MKKILVTGARGFIGRNIVEKLLGEYEIYSPSSNELNLLDEKKVNTYLIENKFDVVIHSAKKDGVRERVQLSDYEILDSNLRMFYNLENCKSMYGKMLYFGSGAEYDRITMSPKVKEVDFGKSIPKDSYGFSKYIMSKETEKANNIYDLRLFGVYGKYEAWDRRFISNAIYRALNGKSITISKNVYFDYMYIDDLMDIIKWFIENTPQHKHYNVCRGNTIDLLTLANIVRDKLQLDCEIEIGESGLKTEYSGDNTRLMQEIAFSFVEHDNAIVKLIDYYKSAPKLFDL